MRIPQYHWPPSNCCGACCCRDARLVAVVAAFAEQAMEKVAMRAQNAGRLGPFTGASWRVASEVRGVWIGA